MAYTVSIPPAGCFYIYNVTKRILSTILCALCCGVGTVMAQHRVWSDRPAFTQVLENENERGLTSCRWDGVFEGDPTPPFPRMGQQATPYTRTWQQGEDTNYLNAETNALTHGQYPNPVRLWEQESYFIGNGRIAASVLNGSGRDRYVLNEVSFWSGGQNKGTINAKGDKSFDGENGPETLDNGFGGSQPVADLMVDFGLPARRDGFRRAINLDDGTVTSTAMRQGVTMRSKALCSYPDQVMALHYTASRSGAMSGNILFVTHRPADTSRAEGNRLMLTCCLPNGMECNAVAEIRTYGGKVSATADGLLKIENADSCTIVVAVETNYAMDCRSGFRGESAAGRVEQRLAQLQGTSFATLYARHTADYQALYNRLRLTLGGSSPFMDTLPTAERLTAYKNSRNDPGLENLIFNFGRYLMIASSRPGSLPAGLQGIWNARVKAPWGNDYHSNINLQMVYWLPEVGNLPECHQALLDYLFAMREPFRNATNEYLAATGDTSRTADGWLVYTSHNPFGGGGWQVNLPGSAWYALHFWEHYAFTHDTRYLKRTAYPVLRELSLYWERHLKTLGQGARGFQSEYKPVDTSLYPELDGVREGTLVVPNGWSPEIGPRGEDGVSHDQEIVSALFAHTIEAARALGTDKAFADRLSQKLSRMLRPGIGKKGNLMEWMIDRDPVTDHRHTSHLFAVYPGSQINMEQTPALAQAAKRSLQMRKTSGNSLRAFAWAWRSCLWARFRDGDRAHEMMEGLMCHNMLDNLLTTQNLPLQMDANYGVAAAMIETLVQSQSGIVELLPAPVAKWPSGTARGIKARGNLEVDLSWAGGRVTSWKIYSAQRKPATVRVKVNGEYHDVTPERR